MVRPRARAPTCLLATLLSFCPVSRFAPPSPTVRTNLLLSDEVCRRCNLACDRLFTLVVKFLHASFWRLCTLAPGYICTPLPPYATPLTSYSTYHWEGRFGIPKGQIFFLCWGGQLFLLRWTHPSPPHFAHCPHQ